ncbi:MAG TPA: carbamoyltransferase C-terminal domain-containing protein [Methylomirabilota bacterium]|nr:carbamoyltransferase C-terminal domain-containing protein [Methylomirabilota bacterium]
MNAVLGISAYHGDAAAALLVDGRLAAAIAEERLTRVKHWAGFPAESIRACLSMAGIEPFELSAIAIARDPRAHFWRKALYAALHRPSLRLVKDRATNRRRVKDAAEEAATALGLSPWYVRSGMHWVEHHPAHLASTFFVSPWEEAAVCAIDGFGDFVSTSWGTGHGNRLDVLGRVHFPHSLGMFYLAITQYLGFMKYGDEYKVMGLAAYGAPDFAPALRQIIHLVDDGTFRLDLRYFRHHTGGVDMTWEGGEPVIGRVFTAELEALLGPARRPEDPLEPRHEAIAASAQAVFEEAAFHLLRSVQRRTGLKRLALAGGCALNSVMNGKIRTETPFTEVNIQPAAGDDGTALGAALMVWHERLGNPRNGFTMDHASWGPRFDAAAVQEALTQRKEDLSRAGCRLVPLEDLEDRARWAAERVAQGQVVGWFQGRMEWGARALGQRSIVADPRRADMRDIINSKIKMRERFRPFAPSILEESLDDYFVGAVPDPFMVQVYPVRPEKRDIIPAVTHVDGTGRLQTVSRSASPEYWQLIKAFEKLSGVPVVLNTSFNENEPIVLTPLQALDCFLRTRMDALVLGSTGVEKGA